MPAADCSRRRAEEELARAQWLDGVGETSLAMQHEVNNPLTALIAQLSFALEMASTREQRDAILAADEQAHRVMAIIKRLGALRDPHNVEPIPGFRMLDIGQRSGEGGSTA